jgi:exosortase A
MTALRSVVLPGAAAPQVRVGKAWAWPLLVLATGLAVLGAAFAMEIQAAIATWERSAAYNHCWLVLPVAVWLGWTRRQRLAGLQPAPSLLGAVMALGAGLAWLVAERLDVMEGRQLAALGVMLALVLAVLGWRVCRVMAAPLGYLVFLVPFGGFLVPVLQQWTAWMIVAGLTLLGIPHYADALHIELAVGTFLVAEACAGLRFVIASLAFGALYAIVMFRSTPRRLAVMALALVVPVIANGLRALGIVLLGHYLGSAEAAAADHIIYGWVFFSLVILLLTLAGLPFRQDMTEPPMAIYAPAPPWRGWTLGRAAALAMVSGLAAPGLVASLYHGPVTAPVTRPAALAMPAGCVPANGAAVRCGSMTMTAQILLFPPGSKWSAVVAERQRLAGQDDEAMTFSVRSDTANWQVRQSPGRVAAVAIAAWHGGEVADDGLRARAMRAWQGLVGAGGRPVLAVVMLEGDEPALAAAIRQGRALLRQTLELQGGLDAAGIAAIAEHLSRGPQS